MNKREAGRILRSIDADTLQTARDLMEQFIPALTGGKWASMEAGERVCYLVALALKIGERRGAANEQNLKQLLALRIQKTVGYFS